MVIAFVAQRTERLASNQKVAGSTPAEGSKILLESGQIGKVARE